MKRISSLLIIILLALTACQPSAGNLADENFTIEQVSTTFNNMSGVTMTEVPSVSLYEFENNFETFTAEFNGTTSPSFHAPTQSTAKEQTTHQKISVPSTQKPTVPQTNKPTSPAPKPTEPVTQAPAKTENNKDEIRAVWISCYDYTSAAGKTKAQYKAITDRMFKTIKDTGLNTAFVHLRANSDAFYKSEIFPYSAMIAGKEGATLNFDPFEVMLESAKAYGISVHGWINPFRVNTKNDVNVLSASNPAKKILDSGNIEGRVCILANGIYYNPAHTENHKLILDGVREIISKYDIDGIHIDDYFYPSTSTEIDKIQYSEYKSDGGTLSLAKWRIANVNAFVSALYSAVKAADPSLTVSISPSGQIDKTLNESYADCRTWLKQSGYADIIIPQIYFGFNHQTEDFNKLLKQWSSLPRHTEVKLMCGIPAYKCAKTDDYAGTGKNEWTQNTDVLARQLKSIRTDKNYSGFAVFSYADLERTACKTEILNLKNEIKK